MRNKAGDINGLDIYKEWVSNGKPCAGFVRDKGLVDARDLHNQWLEKQIAPDQKSWGEFGSKLTTDAPILDEKLKSASLFSVMDDERGLEKRIGALKPRTTQTYMYAFAYKRKTSHALRGVSIQPPVYPLAKFEIEFDAVASVDSRPNEVVRLISDLSIEWPIGDGYHDITETNGVIVFGNDLGHIKRFRVERYDEDFDIVAITVEWPNIATNPHYALTPANGSVDLSVTPLVHKTGAFNSPDGALVCTGLMEVHVKGDPVNVGTLQKLVDNAPEAISSNAVYDEVQLLKAQIRKGDLDVTASIRAKLNLYRNESAKINDLQSLWLKKISEALSVDNFPVYDDIPSIPADIDVAVINDAMGIPQFFVRDNDDGTIKALSTFVLSNEIEETSEISKVVTMIGGLNYAMKDAADVMLTADYTLIEGNEKGQIKRSRLPRNKLFDTIDYLNLPNGEVVKTGLLNPHEVALMAKRIADKAIADKIKTANTTVQTFTPPQPITFNKDVIVETGLDFTIAERIFIDIAEATGGSYAHSFKLMPSPTNFYMIWSHYTAYTAFSIVDMAKGTIKLEQYRHREMKFAGAQVLVKVPAGTPAQQPAALPQDNMIGGWHIVETDGDIADITPPDENESQLFFGINSDDKEVAGMIDPNGKAWYFSGGG